MEIALTALLWVFVVMTFVSFSVWVVVMIIGIQKTKQAEKVINKTSAELMKDIESMIGGKK